MDRAPTEVAQAQEIAQLRAELARVRASHEQLASTLDAANDGIVTLSADGSVYYNIRFVELWGLPEDKLAGLEADDILAFQLTRVKDPRAWQERVQRRRANPEDEEHSTVELKDGRVLECCVTLRHVGGRRVGTVVIFRDITERLRHEQKLLFNQLVLQNSGPKLWLDCRSHEVRYANPAACRHLGYELDELLGLRISDFDPEYTDAQADELIAELSHTGRTANFVSVHRRKDGTLRDVDLTMFVTELADRAMLIVSIMDVTDERRAQKELKRQHAVLTSLLNSLPDAVCYKDLEGHFLGCNEAFARVLHREVDDLIGRTNEELFSAPFARMARTVEGAVRATLKPRRLEHHGNAPPEVFDTVLSPLWDEQGSAVGLVSISRDITERKRQEGEIRRAKEMAEDATRMKSDFLANMSHEIRTPLNAIIGLSNLVLRTELSVRQRNYVAKVQTSGQHLLGVINDILDFSKVEAGKLDLEHADFELEKVLDDTSSLVGEKAHAKGLELVFDVAPDVPRQLVGDALRLGQILLNYANNAVKFTDEGEIVIAVRASERTDGDVLLHFRVADTGIGLNRDQIDRLFQSFSQADTSTTRRFGGTGLGLAISKKLAELMGGEVGVESEHGKGSTFWFSARLGIAAAAHREFLPNPGGAARAGQAAASATSGESRLADLKGARILLVEDNDINQQVARELLEHAGFVVDVADNGEIAHGQVQRTDYDLVFMDMHMPVMDGITATRRIRALGARFATLPIVAMTANAMEQDRRSCLDAGMNDFLVKPLDPDAMWNILLRWIRQRAAALADGVPQGIQGLDTSLGLSRMMNKRPLYVAMLRRWTEGQRDAVGELRRALAAADCVTAERIAHTSKAVAGNIGATLVQERAGQLEMALRERRGASELAPLVDALDAVMSPLVAKLAAHFPTGDKQSA